MEFFKIYYFFLLANTRLNRTNSNECKISFSDFNNINNRNEKFDNKILWNKTTHESR